MMPLLAFLLCLCTCTLGSERLFSFPPAQGLGLRLSGFDVRRVNGAVVELLNGLTARHGVIVLEQSANPLTSDDLLEFADKFGNPVLLPNGFGFNSTDKAHAMESYITNITNIDPVTGEAKSVKTAEYLHNDGDFWQNNYIYSFLYGEVIPERGGRTQFIDSQLAHDLLLNEHPALYAKVQNLSVAVDVNVIPDFKGSPFLDQFNAAHDVAKHRIIDTHRVTGEAVLFYGCKAVHIDGLSEEESAQILGEIDSILMSAASEASPMSYDHSWNENDLVLWDNTRVMHRSMGGYGPDPRKLWRVQSRIQADY